MVSSILLCFALTAQLDGGALDAAVDAGSSAASSSAAVVVPVQFPAVSGPAKLASSSVGGAAASDAPAEKVVFDIPGLTPEDKGVNELIKLMLDAHEKKDSSALAAAILMLIVWILRKIFAEQLAAGKTDLLPWIAMGGAVASGILLGVQAHLPLKETIWSGVMIGLSASGAWSLFGRHIPKILPALKNLLSHVTVMAAKPADKPADPPKPEEKKP